MSDLREAARRALHDQDELDEQSAAGLWMIIVHGGDTLVAADWDEAFAEARKTRRPAFDPVEQYYKLRYSLSSLHYESLTESGVRLGFCFHCRKPWPCPTIRVLDPPACSNHRPIQHRDAKPPWCRNCGLTASGETPVAKFHFPNKEETGLVVEPLCGDNDPHGPHSYRLGQCPGWKTL